MGWFHRLTSPQLNSGEVKQVPRPTTARPTKEIVRLASWRRKQLIDRARSAPGQSPTVRFRAHCWVFRRQDACERALEDDPVPLGNLADEDFGLSLDFSEDDEDSLLRDACFDVLGAVPDVSENEEAAFQALLECVA